MVSTVLAAQQEGRANPAGAHSFVVRLVTRGGELLRREAVSVVAPGLDGYFGVKANHAPLIAALGIGAVTVTTPEGQSERFAVAGGMAEVRDNEMVVLADIGERAEEIDIARAERAAERARARLRGEAAEGRVDHDRAEIALARALNRLHVARHAQ